MKHPLTDEMIDKIAHFDSDLTREQFVNRNEDMRAAADWQLEQVIEWLQINLGMFDDDTGYRYVKDDVVYPADRVVDWVKVITDLKKAMRPQQQEKS
jgi:hypothetical protein